MITVKYKEGYFGLTGQPEVLKFVRNLCEQVLKPFFDPKKGGKEK